MLMSEPAPRPTHARLDFVKDQHQFVLVGQLTETFQVSRRRQIDAAFALNRLDQNRARFRVDQPDGGIQVTEGRIGKTGQERFQPLMILGLTGGGECAQSRPMEAVHHGNDLVPSGLAVESSQFQGRLDRIGAAVAEEALPAEPTALAQGSSK